MTCKPDAMLKMEELLNRNVAKNAATVVADAARAELMRSKHTLSGDDSNLQNTWEEICVQVQDEQSFFWEAYESAMRDAVLGVMCFLDRSVLETLWLYTDEGWDLRYDLQADEKEGITSQAGYEPPDIPVDEEAIARDIIANYLLPRASNYSNSRIEEFLYPGYDDSGDTDDTSDGVAPEQIEDEQSSANAFEIEYYDDTWDSSGYLACFDRHYICAIRPNDPEPKWEFLPTDGARWDSVHQRVYRNFRADRIEKEQLPPSLPQPPTEVPLEVMNPPPPPLPKPIRTEDFPAVAEYLHRCSGRGTAAFHLVLFEDRYESACGDGEFHYPEIVFFDLKDAENYEGDKSGCYKYHIRPGVIWLDQDVIRYEVPGRIFDHFSGEEVLRLISEAIKQKNIDEC
jgi:hypothetical protein